MKVQRIEECFIDQQTHAAIGDLLSQSFLGYPKSQSYFKQLPNFRYLVWDKKQLIGHMGVDFRVIKHGGATWRIFGVVDLCIQEAYQHKKIASSLLNQLEELGRTCQVDSLILMAQNPSYYEQHGFFEVKNRCMWLMINNGSTLGVASRRIMEGFMVKILSDKTWEEGTVDFLGHIF